MGNKAKGYILGAAAAATYGLNPLFALPLYEDGMTADSVLFFRYLIALPVLAAMIKLRGRSFKVSGSQLCSLAVLGILVAVSSLTLFLSYNFMDVGIASTILFVYPIMVALIMVGVFHEKIKPLTIGCIVTALAGIGLLYKSSGEETLSVAGTLLVMASALSYAIYIVAINKTSLARVATLTVTFYMLLFGVSLFGVRLALAGNIEIPTAGNWYLWGALIGLAVFPTVVSFACTTSAIQYIGSTNTAILGALEPVTAVLIGVCVFGEILTPRDIVGLLMIIGAVTIVIAGPKMSLRLSSIRRLFPRIRKQ
jgi:drug/metabolite transporter (DMT)-like permease